MKRITLLSSICITALLLTSCGGKTTPVITKSDPVAGIYLGGKLPGISEEMMKDEKVSVHKIIDNIKDLPGPSGYLEEARLLSEIGVRIKTDDPEATKKMLDNCVSAWSIAGYSIDRSSGIFLYSKHGYDYHFAPDME